MSKYNFSGNKRLSIISYVLTIILSFCLIGTTLAFFMDSDFASGYIGMSGAVEITAVGGGVGYQSIEDVVDNSGNVTSNLVTHLVPDNPDEYILVPEEPLDIKANCKVKKSVTKPLLRSRISFKVRSPEGDHIVENSDDEYFQILLNSFKVVVSKAPNNDGEWIYSSDDNYFYYIKKNQSFANVGDYLLQEINVNDADKIIHFLNEPIIYPDNTSENVDYAGYYLQIIVTFQGVQNFIPDANGSQLSNTINNSKVVFNDQAPQNIA